MCKIPTSQEAACCCSVGPSQQTTCTPLNERTAVCDAQLWMAINDAITCIFVTLAVFNALELAVMFVCALPCADSSILWNRSVSVIMFEQHCLQSMPASSQICEHPGCHHCDNQTHPLLSPCLLQCVLPESWREQQDPGKGRRHRPWQRHLHDSG